MIKYVLSIALSILFALSVQAQPTVRVGVLKFGTVNWEIDVIKHHQLDKKYQFDLKVTPLASKNASAVALQSNAVDIILTDWLWVNRQRFENKLYSIYPMSKTHGGLYIPAHSDIKTITDLKGKKIGIAGGAVDKSWLLLQAYSQKVYGLDLKKEAKPTFAVPPLLNQLMLRGELTAAINFWHYGARLKAAGFKQLITIPEILTELGVKAQVPLLGWVFDQGWAFDNRNALNAFLQASAEAKQILFSSDEEWQRLRPLIKAENDVVFTTLQTDYRAGLLSQFGSHEIAASQRIFEILAEQGGSALVGKATALSEGTFWQKNSVDNKGKALVTKAD